MIRETLTPLIVATLVVLAGCAGAIAPTEPSGGDASDVGTVNVYISDERNAINDFEHLNVTISSVGFKQADTDDDDADDEDDTNTTTTTATTTESTNDTTTETTTTNDSTTETTTVEHEDTTTETEEAEEADDDDADDADDEEDEADDDDDESDGEDWVVREVQNVTIDLTEYQGENATLLSEFEIPNGTYTKTFVYISDINATLTNGEHVRVKLPSEKLHINKEFTVGNGESVDFVFDITVFKAGNSGKYILKPVVSESGTDVPFHADDDDDEDDADDEREGPPDDVRNGDDDDAAELDAAFLGNVTPGENVTVSVTQNGTAVEGAQVFVEDRRVGKTGANGTISVAVPADAEEFELEIKYRDEDADLEAEFEDGEDDDSTTTTAAA